MKTIGEFGYSGDQKIAFVQVALSQLLGGSLDLWLETHGGDADTLGRFVSARIDAKKHRDQDALNARFALTCAWFSRRILV